MSWNTILPPELWLTVLEYVAGPDPDLSSHEPRGYAPENTYAWAPCAAVSREWQEFFERRTFAALVLRTGQGDVEPFCAAVTRCPARLTYIGRLHMSIDLPEYSRPESLIEEDATTTACPYGGYYARSPRGKNQGRQRPSLGCATMICFAQVRLIAPLGSSSSSVSGATATRSTTTFASRCRGRRSRDDRNQILEDMGFSLDRESSSFYRARSTLIVRPRIFRRALGRRPLVLGKDPDDRQQRRRRRHRHTLPVATVVRKFVLSRRFSRSIHPATLARLLNVGMPRVQSVCLEPWRPVSEANRDIVLHGYDTLLKRLPPSADRLSLFLESDCIVHHFERHPRPVFFEEVDGTDPARRRRPPPCLGLRVAVVSCHLTVLNVAFLVEAEDVLAAMMQMPAAVATWPRLRRLVLTTSTLMPATAPAAIEQLLCTAANAVTRMPHLRQFELWFAHGRHSCAFTVDGDGGSVCTPRLRLQATWPGAAAVALTQDVLDAWQAVVATWTHRHLEVTNQTITLDAAPGARSGGRKQSLDARRLVMDNPGTLAREAVSAMSRRGMAIERAW